MIKNNYYLGLSGAEKKLSSIGRTVEPGRTIHAVETRLANKTLVRDFVAVKRSWRFSWKSLEGLDADVKDQGLGRDSLVTLYEAGVALVLQVPNEDGTHEAVDVMFGLNLSDKRVMVSPRYEYRVVFDLMEV